MTGDVYGSYSVSSGRSPVHKDTQLSASGDLYLMSGSEVGVSPDHLLYSLSFFLVWGLMKFA